MTSSRGAVKGEHMGANIGEEDDEAMIKSVQSTRDACTNTWNQQRTGCCRQPTRFEVLREKMISYKLCSRN